MDVPLVDVALPKPRLLGEIPLRTEVKSVLKIAPFVDSDEIPKTVVPVTDVAESRP